MASFPPPSIIEQPGENWGAADDSSEDAYTAILRVREIPINAVSRFSRRGIPDHVRATYWKLIIGYLPLRPDQWLVMEEAKEKEFLDILSIVCRLDDNGNVVGSDGGGISRMIDVDIPRTMPSLHFFLTDEVCYSVDGVPVTFSPAQQSLRRILHTYAAVNKGLGYVQGMNELVGHLLYCFSGGVSANVNRKVESDVFFCFQAMLGYLGDNFCRSLDFDRDIGVTSTIRNYEKLLHFLDVELWAHLEDVQIKSEYYAFRWITLLFTQEFTVPDVFRVWDFLLSFGADLKGAVFFTGVAMLHYQRDRVLSMSNFGELLQMLQAYPSCDVNKFLKIALNWIELYGMDMVSRVKVSTDEEIEVLREQYDAKDCNSRPAAGTWLGALRAWGRPFYGYRR